MSYPAYIALDRSLEGLILFRGLLDQKAVAAARRMLVASDAERIAAYAELARLIWSQGGNLTDLIERAVLLDDNFFVREAAAGRAPCAALYAQADRELDILATLAALPSRPFYEELGDGAPALDWIFEKRDFKTLFRQRLAQIQETGYGIFAAYHMFWLDDEGNLVPVAHPDPQRLDALCGYAAERERILNNALALLAGIPASNMLLYGDAGTGKSSTIKAIANELCGKGLRLVQLRQDQLQLIPALLDFLSDNPLKFMLFIDDLSFGENDANFTALKAVLEGSISSRPGNVIICATSNRRHLVRESFSGRAGDELHLNDTLEETTSLAARFGLIVNFSRPERELYLEIARRYTEAYGLKIPQETLEKEAEAFAIRTGGRTPRTARQFVEHKAAENIL